MGRTIDLLADLDRTGEIVVLALASTQRQITGSGEVFGPVMQAVPMLFGELRWLRVEIDRLRSALSAIAIAEKPTGQLLGAYVEHIEKDQHIARVALGES